MTEKAERKEKFTPGPCGFQENFLTVYQEYRKPLGTNAVAKCLEIGNGGGCQTPHEEAIANGYLYAAAPDMYAALECILNLASTPAANGELVYIDFMEIRSALAKARGES